MLGGAALGALGACTFPDVVIDARCEVDPACTAVEVKLPACVQATDCSVAVEPCITILCTDEGLCATEPVVGPCVGEEGVCTGDGACVECVEPEDCTAPLTCVDTFCVAMHCVNGVTDGDETDEDCGGACGPCDEGAACATGTDCVTGACIERTCATCTGDLDCASAASFCNPATGICEPERGLGVACSASSQCASSACPEDDLICCDSACDGTCEACLYAKTGKPDGECHPVLAGSDADGECLALGELVSCDGAGKCRLFGGG